MCYIEDSLIKELPKLKNIAFKLTQNNEDAEDLVSETCVKILSNKEKFKEDTNIRGWFTIILKNNFINTYRRKVRVPMCELFENTTDNLLTECTDASTIYKEYLKEMESNPDYKYFVAYLNGYQYNQIAEIFEINIGTLKSKIFAFRKELQAKLTGKSFKKRRYNRQNK